VTAIDATARVASSAAIGRDVVIGPYCVVGSDAVIEDGCRLLAHVYVAGCTTLGARTVVYPFASLGTPPQSVHYRGGRTQLIVGADCQIREGCTLNTGTEDGGGVTRIGDGCYLMANAHVGHDCTVGNRVVFANNVALGGHVTVGDHVVLGGLAAVRQFVRVGTGAMIAGLSAVRADVIPWGTAQGALAKLVGINVVGLSRRGVSRSHIRALWRGYRFLFLGPGEFRARLEAIEVGPDDTLLAEVVAFIKSATRPLTMAARVRSREP
jgi:UDP-N-acetylglucosamine acyltransferase